MKNTIQNTLLLLAVFTVSYFGSLMGKITPIAVAADEKKVEQVPDIIKAKAFILVDDEGLGRCVISMGKCEKEDIKQPYILLRDENLKNRLYVEISPDKNPSVKLLDEEENRRAVLNLTDDGSPGLALYSKNSLRCALSLALADDPSLSLFDDSEEMRGSFALIQDISSLIISDKKGKIKTQLCVNKEGNANLFFHDENEDLIRGVLGMIKGKCSYDIFDKNGNKTWSTTNK